MSKPTRHIDLSTFTRDCSFYGKLNLLTTVKSFDLSAIRKRYLKSQKENKSGAVGSVERREPGTGGVVACTLENGKGHYEVIKKMTEPRGIAYRNGKLAIASEKKIYVIFEEEGKYTELSYPWFSYIHSLDFNPKNSNKLLLDSSGFDCIFEFDVKQNKPTFDWFAWENGFNSGKDPKTGEELLLTRNKELAIQWEKEGKRVLFIENPKGVYLPTAWRSFFLNTVRYQEHSEDKIVVTSFHKEHIFLIDLKSKEITPVMGGLKNPHGGMSYNGGFMATSTRSGEIVTVINGEETRIDFTKLPGKSKETADMEWVQNTICIKELLITVDSNRNCLTIIDLKNKRYDSIGFNPDWAVQDLIEDQTDLNHLKTLSNI